MMNKAEAEKSWQKAQSIGKRVVLLIWEAVKMASGMIWRFSKEALRKFGPVVHDGLKSVSEKVSDTYHHTSTQSAPTYPDTIKEGSKGLIQEMIELAPLEGETVMQLKMKQQQLKDKKTELKNTVKKIEALEKEIEKALNQENATAAIANSAEEDLKAAWTGTKRDKPAGDSEKSKM